MFAFSRAGVLLAFVGLFAAVAPAQAQIEKAMRHCYGQPCPYFRAPITIPDGWAEHDDASRELDVQMLLPKDQEFNTAPAHIYVSVRQNRNKEARPAMLREIYSEWKDWMTDGKMTRLADVSRANGKPAFQRYQLDAPDLAVQRFEIASMVLDGDKDGNEFFVVVYLSGKTREALKSNEAAYLSILKSY